ncbi:TPA: DUF3850 domain-containing protein [Escherichia coli]
MTKPENPVVHTLKTLPQHFAAVRSGKKRAELRINDRDFREGDMLILEEALPGSDMTGKSVCVRITHVADVSDYAPGYVLLSIAPVWIPCSERMPPVGVDVQLFVSSTGEQFTGFNLDDTGDFQYAQCYGAPIVCEATHWMPLPEPPIKQGE